MIGSFNLRNSLLGVGLAIISGLLPFAIWNLKGYLDTIPHDLEEAASVDGAIEQPDVPADHPAAGGAAPWRSPAFLGFVGGWTEFYFSWMFLTKSTD